MCANCGFPAAPGHWTEAGAETSSDRFLARHRRVGVIRALLAPYRLTAHDDGATPGVIVSSLTGNQEIAQDLSAVWRIAERLRGAPVDPLDPAFTGDPDRNRAETEGS